MGVCCIAFDIDGMLFELFMILFVKKNIQIYKTKSSHFMFSLGFMIFPAFLETNSGGGGGGGGGVILFLLEKTLLAHFMFSLTGGKWFLQIVDKEF